MLAAVLHAMQGLWRVRNFAFGTPTNPVEVDPEFLCTVGGIGTAMIGDIVVLLRGDIVVSMPSTSLEAWALDGVMKPIQVIFCPDP